MHERRLWWGYIAFVLRHQLLSLLLIIGIHPTLPLSSMLSDIIFHQMSSDINLQFLDRQFLFCIIVIRYEFVVNFISIHFSSISFHRIQFFVTNASTIVLCRPTTAPRNYNKYMPLPLVVCGADYHGSTSFLQSG